VIKSGSPTPTPTPPTQPHPQPPTPQPQVYIIRTSGARLLALINDVMDAAALRQNRLVLARGRVALRALVGDVVDLTRSLVRGGWVWWLWGLACRRVAGTAGGARGHRRHSLPPTWLPFDPRLTTAPPPPRQAEPDVQITNLVPSDLFVCADAARLVQVRPRPRRALG
jgi:signal transduction histidine kinase